MTTSIRRLVGAAALGGALALAAIVPPGGGLPRRPQHGGHRRHLRGRAAPSPRPGPGQRRAPRPARGPLLRPGRPGVGLQPGPHRHAGPQPPVRRPRSPGPCRRWRRITENVGYAPTAGPPPPGVHGLGRAPGQHPRQPGPAGRHRLRARRQRPAVVDGELRRRHARPSPTGARRRSARPATPRPGCGGGCSPRAPTPTQVEADATNLLRLVVGRRPGRLPGRLDHPRRAGARARSASTAPPSTASPTPPASYFWIQQRQRGVTPRQDGDRASPPRPSSRSSTATSDDRAFVEQVYRNVLDREPDASGTDYWVDQLRPGRQPGQGPRRLQRVGREQERHRGRRHRLVGLRPDDRPDAHRRRAAPVDHAARRRDHGRDAGPVAGRQRRLRPPGRRRRLLSGATAGRVRCRASAGSARRAGAAPPC